MKAGLQADAPAVLGKPTAQDDNIATPEFGPGDLLRDRWEVVVWLGGGTFGDVYRVVDRGPSGREYALKIFRGEDAYAEREIRALSQIPVTLPHVVKFRWCDFIDGAWWIWTEFIPGKTLDRLGTLDFETVRLIGRQLLETLQVLHPDDETVADLTGKGEMTSDEWDRVLEAQNGLIHRDLKLQNALYDEASRCVTIIDFNVAVPARQPVVTKVCTPAYLPPDHGFTVWEPDVDLFAVGIMLAELLQDGRHPYQEGHPFTRVLLPFDPAIPPSVRDFLRRACAPDGKDRFPNAGAMLAAWEGAWASSLDCTDGETAPRALERRLRAVYEARIPGAGSDSPFEKVVRALQKHGYLTESSAVEADALVNAAGLAHGDGALERCQRILDELSRSTQQKG